MSYLIYLDIFVLEFMNHLSRKQDFDPFQIKKSIFSLEIYIFFLLQSCGIGVLSHFQMVHSV